MEKVKVISEKYNDKDVLQMDSADLKRAVEQVLEGQLGNIDVGEMPLVQKSYDQFSLSDIEDYSGKAFDSATGVFYPIGTGLDYAWGCLSGTNLIIVEVDGDTLYTTVYHLEDFVKSSDLKLSNIKDSAGNPRFIEGNITDIQDSTFTKGYGKWSLSGTHLMIVVAGNYPAERAFTAQNGFLLANISIPNYVYDKISDFDGVIDIKERNIYRSTNAYGPIQGTLNCYLRKRPNNTLDILLDAQSTFTTEYTGYFRVAFDLLIDSDYE